jgi:hypothetical protein
VQVLFCAGWQLADHPAKTDPGAGVAVKLTWLFNVKLAEHPVPVDKAAVMVVASPWAQVPAVVASPVAVMVATFALLDDHVTWLVTS